MTSPITATLPAPRRPASARSAVSNGKRLLTGISAGSAEGRRFRDVIEDLTAELGGTLSHAEQLQVRTVAGLVIHVEQLQAAMLKGEPVNSEELTRVSNSVTRTLAALRRSRPAGRRRGRPVHEVLRERPGGPA